MSVNISDLTIDDLDILFEAIDEYEARKRRNINPDGYFDKGGRWWPEDNEECECCKYIRRPSRAWPYSYLTHCRSLEHVAHLFDADPAVLRKVMNLTKSFKKAKDDVREIEKIIKRYKVSERETLLMIAQACDAHAAVAEIKNSMLARERRGAMRKRNIAKEEAVASL